MAGSHVQSLDQLPPERDPTASLKTKPSQVWFHETSKMSKPPGGKEKGKEALRSFHKHLLTRRSLQRSPCTGPETLTSGGLPTGSGGSGRSLAEHDTPPPVGAFSAGIGASGP